MATAAPPPPTTTSTTGRAPPPPTKTVAPPPHPQQQHWHATYEDYLDTFLTSDDAFFFDGDLDTARALVEAGLKSTAAAAGVLTRRQWTLARRRAAAAAAASATLRLGLLRLSVKRPSTLLLLSDPALLPARDCPLLSLLAQRERAVRAGSLTVVVFLRSRNAAGQEVSAYVDLAARLGLRAAPPDGVVFDEEEEGGELERQQQQQQQQGIESDDDDDDGDEDAAERRAAAADRRARDASRGMAGVFARVRPFLPLPTDLCYYNHATRRARANPTAQWQVTPAFGEEEEEGGGGGEGDEEGEGGEQGYGGGRLLLRHVRDRRVLDVASASGRTVVDLSPLPATAALDSASGGGSGGRGGATTAAAAAATTTPLMLSERAYLLQAVVFEHVVRRR